MRYIGQHISAIIEQYDGTLPLAHYLKGYFKQHPILGSRDRRMLTGLAYAYYRGAKGTNDLAWLGKLTDEWISHPKKSASFSFAEWLVANDIHIDTEALLPNAPALSEGITREGWLASMLTQPTLFIRVRKDREKILHLLGQAGIPYSMVTETCVSLPNGAGIDALLPRDCYVVQDAASQGTGTYFAPRPNESWYDCCAGAGGKSLLLKDTEPTVQLTATDRRESILHNLKERFRLYGYKAPATFVIDVADAGQLSNTLGNRLFDNIICDAPCSGSGTWARTPEQLYFFKPDTLNGFAELQRKIATHVAAYLKPGGRLIYITCSVFEQENEGAVNHILSSTRLQLLTSQLINGTLTGADSMYVAVLQK